MRIRLLPESATTKLPLVSTTTPDGEEKEAPVPKPSLDAGAPLPASVVTCPEITLTLRMRWITWSAT